MSATGGAHVLDRISLGFACLLLVASTGFGAAAASLSSTLATPEFVAEFTAAATRERFVLFPLGVATSIVTFVAGRLSQYVSATGLALRIPIAGANSHASAAATTSGAYCRSGPMLSRM